MIDNHPATVGREHVLNLLRLHDVEVSPDEEGDLYDLRKGEVVESQALSPGVPRHMVGRLSRKFGVPMGLFFEPPHTRAEGSGPPAEIGRT